MKVLLIGVGTYYKTDRYRASQAVNGNTRGVWYTSSITHTQYEQGAWWQVDLNDFFGIRYNMKVLLIGVGTEICFIRNTNLVVA
jgi:hypothetical protein